MPVSVPNSKLIYGCLKDNEVRIVSALPETWLVHLIRMAEEDAEMTLVRLAKEEEGVAISAGAHLAGVPRIATVRSLDAFSVAFDDALAARALTTLVAKVEAVGPSKFVTDLALLENRFQFQRYLSRGIDSQPAC